MKRGIEVVVTRPVSSSVFFTVDDADPKYAAWFKPDGKIDWRTACGGIEPLATKEAISIGDLDWDFGDKLQASEVEAVEWKEVPADVAEDFSPVEL